MNTTVEPKAIIGLILRTALAAFGGSLVVDPQNLEALTGAGVILVIGVWSYVQKLVAARNLKAALVAEPVAF